MSGRLFFLDIGQHHGPPPRGRILSANDDGTDLKVLVDNIKTAPDGLAIDSDRKHIWWTNMGNEIAKDGSSYAHDGFIQRCDIDGNNVQSIIPNGVTHTPKQCIIAPKSKKLYWCDREGMRVMRANLDGSNVEVLIVSGETEADMRDPRNWCVGVAVDETNKHLFWSQKGPSKGNKGRIFRAGLDVPEGQDPSSRKDVETLFDNLPEPIDLEFVEEQGLLYWTDRGSEDQGGNSVNRASIGPKASSASLTRTILVEQLHEGIGITLDLKRKRMFFGDLEGSLYVSDLDGKNERILLQGMGSTTGIAYVEEI
ncbi:hypothetical protein AAFC00_000862 [Neodothiora populina]|uniref:3-hydroxyacyl-CoA dehydrogenase n=1 Tax=Neodothiora populina TaxID=2781224 RepID=A0ABR3PM50_9PEZI